MKLERIKNTNPMQATEMANILGGATYCTGTSGPGNLGSKKGGYYCKDVTSTIYNEEGDIIGTGGLYTKDDADTYEQLEKELRTNLDLSHVYIGKC